MALLRSFGVGCRGLTSVGRGRLFLESSQSSLFQRSSRCVTMKVSEAGSTSSPKRMSYDEKNMQLNRPLSPHLLIYKPQLTSMMSISHRITGLIMIGYGVCLAASSFSNYDVPRIVEAVESLHIPGALVFLAKYILAFPVAYHMVNGVRHLTWDLAIGISKKKVYNSGYAALGLTVLMSIYFASL